MNRGGAVALVVTPLLALGGCLGSVLLLGGQQATAAGCGPAAPGISVDVAALAGLPGGTVAGYSGTQLTNAAAIINTGQALGMDVRAQTIAVMTAMGESALAVVDHGDAAGPDSRGLFQQRANGAWGTYADRMDPATSATNFYRALAAVPGWSDLPPTLAAHQVQHNADPYYYATYWDSAVAVVTTLAATGPASPDHSPTTPGGTVAGIAPGTGELTCTTTSPVAVATSGWARPSTGPLTSGYGMRWHPTKGIYKLHGGLDFGPGCDAPIYAAADGVVVQAGPAPSYGHLIVIDHGGGVTTLYAHMFAAGVLVHVGQAVTAGTQIARVGTDGDSTGCHLHFEVHLNGQRTDPAPFLAARGVQAG